MQSTDTEMRTSPNPGSRRRSSSSRCVGIRATGCADRTDDHLSCLPMSGTAPSLGDSRGLWLLGREWSGVQDLIFDGCESSERALTAPTVIGPFDPGDDRDAELVAGFPALPVEDVLLQQREERFHRGVAAGCTDAAHRAGEVTLGAPTPPPTKRPQRPVNVVRLRSAASPSRRPTPTRTRPTRTRQRTPRHAHLKQVTPGPGRSRSGSAQLGGRAGLGMPGLFGGVRCLVPLTGGGTVGGRADQ